MAAKKKTAEPKQEKEIKSENIVNITDAGPCKKKVSIEIPEGKIKKMLEGQYRELRKDALVPGFRKGRVPQRLLEKRFGKEIGEQAKVKLLLEASEAALKDNNIDSLGEPDIDPEKIEMPAGGSIKFDFEIEVRPEFDLPSLEHIPAEKPKLKVTDESVESEIAEIQKRLGVWKPKEGKIEADDQIIADVVLKPGDGEQEKIDNTEIYARTRGFVGKVPVENLDKLLVGAKAGDVKTTTTEVPSSYFDEKYRDKKVSVEIKINDVKHLEPAELNESFFKRFGTTDKAGLADMIRQRNEANIENQQKEAMRQSVREYLLSKVDFELPANIVGDQSQQLLQRQYTRLLMQGLKAEDITNQMDQLRASSEEQAKEQLRSFFIMDAIAKKLDIQTSEEEINGYIAQAAMYRQTRPEKLREQMARDGSLTQVALEIREIKCIDKILESAKISEVAPEKIAAKHEAAHKHEHAKKASAEHHRTEKAEEKADRAEKKVERAEKKVERAEKEVDRAEKKAEKAEKAVDKAVKAEKKADKAASGEHSRTEKDAKPAKKSAPAKKSDKSK